MMTGMSYMENNQLMWNKALFKIKVCINIIEPDLVGELGKVDFLFIYFCWDAKNYQHKITDNKVRQDLNPRLWIQ